VHHIREDRIQPDIMDAKDWSVKSLDCINCTSYCGVVVESQGTLLGNGITNASMQQRWHHSGMKQLWEAVFSTVRGQADSDATMEHVILRRTHQQSNCKKKCFLRGPPRGYIRRTNGSSELFRRLGVGLQAGGPRPLVRSPCAEQCSLETAVSDCSLQAARTPGIALVRNLQPGND
jgi:hypothetical protein